MNEGTMKQWKEVFSVVKEPRAQEVNPLADREDTIMKESILKNKTILAVNKDPDVLEVLEEEILEGCPGCHFHKATTYREAVERMLSFTYDAVLLDIAGVHSLNLTELAVIRNFPIAMFTAHPLTPEALESRFGMKIQAYLPEEKMGEIVLFLEDMLRQRYSPGWRHFFHKIGFLGKKFEIDWGKKSPRPQKKWVLSGAKV